MADAPFYDPPEHSSNAAAAANDTQMEGPVCWKCEGTGILRHRKRASCVTAWDNRHPGPPPPCTICKGCGRLQPKKKQRVHSNDPGVVTTRKFVPSAWASNGVPGPAPARIGAPERFEALFDKGAFERIAVPDVPHDPLKFKDQKKYAERLKMLGLN